MWYWKIKDEKSRRYFSTLDAAVNDIQFENKKWHNCPSLVTFIKIGRKRVVICARVANKGTLAEIILPDLTLFPQERGIR